MIRPKVIWPIFRRNFASYFSGVLGYLFIVVFVVAFGAMAFNTRFFTANEPSFHQLTQWYPLLLLFFIPAITMGVWAEERKLATDELLFTLPATDLEILLAKFFSALAVYTVALVFSTAHVAVLAYLGNPDWGLICTTYFGYWIAGAALLSAGMVASILSTSMTVAFVIGVVICGVPVFMGYSGGLVWLSDYFDARAIYYEAGGWLSGVFSSILTSLSKFSGGLSELFEELSLREQFRDFGMGVIPLSGLLYFLGLTTFMLYINLVLMTRRHWSAGRRANMGIQYSARTASLAIILVCLAAWAGYAAIRIDATSEKLFSLSPATKQMIRELDAERPIEIQAFLSPEVPRDYVETQKQLIGLLRQFDEMGGSRLQVRYVDVTKYSKEADEAEHFGITPVRVVSEVEGGGRSQSEVYLGAVVVSSFDKVVVPFFGKGLPIEYELTRSVQTVASKDRHTVGVLTTDARLMGGRDWDIVTELKKQYEVEEVSAATEIDGERFDVLLAAMPSSLTDPEMNNLVTYVKSGKPVLIFDDPFPLAFGGGFGGISNAPRQPKPSPGGGMMMGQRPPPPEPKADGGRATRLLDALGLRWQYDRIVFDTTNPHPGVFRDIPAEYVFVTRDGGNEEAFSGDSPISSGLQELVCMYAGTVEKDSSSAVDFVPLLSTGDSSGVLEWPEFTNEGFNPMTMSMSVSPRSDPFRKIDEKLHHIAAHVTSDRDGSEVNAIFVADFDMIADVFFDLRNTGMLDIEFDNVTFVLNAVDMLAGDDSFIELRSRRAKHRTLTRVEQRNRVFLEEANKAEKAADKDAEEELEKRKKQLKSRVEEIQKNENLDAIAKMQQMQQAQEAEQQRLSLAEAQIEQRKQDQIQKIRANTSRQQDAVRSWARAGAVLLPPIPALLVGIFVFFRRWMREKRTVVSSRRV